MQEGSKVQSTELIVKSSLDYMYLDSPLHGTQSQSEVVRRLIGSSCQVFEHYNI